MIHFPRRSEPRLRFEPLGDGGAPRRLPVLDFHRSADGSEREPAHGTIRLRLDTGEERQWSLGLGGAWRVRLGSQCRVMRLNGPLAIARVGDAEIQTWRWEEASA